MSYLINITKDRVPKHSHKNYEIICCTKGRGIFHVPGKDIELVPGKFVIIPPGTDHYSTILDEDYERMYINGNFDQVLYVTEPMVIADNHTHDGLTLSRMIYNNRHANIKYLSSLINSLTLFLLQNTKMKNELYVTVENIVEEINSNLGNCNLKLNGILQKSGYAEDYIRAQFKNIIGKTPVEFLNEIRIKHACYLIDIYKDSIILSDIAEKCGYLDYVYFSRKFKQVMGMSPRKYSEDITKKS